MMRPMALLSLLLLSSAACHRGDDLASRPGSRTASPYSTGTDSGSVGQRVEGTNTGVSLEAPAKIPGVLTALHQIAGPGKAPDKAAVTALRGNLGGLEAAMRADFGRAGLANTGAFHALSDSISEQLGGGAGGLANSLDARGAQLLSGRVQRLVQTYNAWMRTARS
jgi:hypothetical protein